MRKLTLILFTILLTNVSIGQDVKTEENSDDKLTFQGLNKIEKSPQFVLIVDSTCIKIDNFEKYDIEPKWIESVSVMNDDFSRKLYGNENGVIFIYTKKEYRTEVLDEIEKNTGS